MENKLLLVRLLKIVERSLHFYNLSDSIILHILQLCIVLVNSLNYSFGEILMKSPIDTKPFVEYCKVLSLKVIYYLLESETRWLYD